MRKRILVLMICCIVLVLGLSVVSHAEDRVGYINLQRLVNESAMGKAAKTDIIKLRGEREAVLRNKLKEVNGFKELINKEGNSMDPADKRDKVQKLKRVYKEYQRLLADAREDIANEDKELVAIILQKADGVLKKVAKKKKFAIILKDPNAIGFLDPSVDITDAVLKALNR
jgi:outer membrane protein